MARNPKRDQAYEMWQQSKGMIALTAISEKIGVPVGTIRAWKNRDNWNATLQNSECNVTDKKVQRCKKRGGQPGNKNATGSHGEGNQNAVGNNGGAPQGNANALIHGLYAKYLPAETFEIAQGIVAISPLDILWGNISIQYAAIVRAQKIMEVESKDELIEHIKSDGINATTYEFQFAWDRQATFMAAQSKAMTTLNKLIKQYDELCKSDLATEEQRLRIEKIKSDMQVNKERLDLERQKIQPPMPEDLPDDGFIDALKSESSAIWAADDGDKDG